MSAIDSASLNCFESLADWGAWLVIVGVAGEGLEIMLKVLQHKLTNEKFLAWCKKHEFGIEMWGAIFWLMVVAGLAMEFRYGHKAKTITDAENVRLTLNAADLNLKAESFRLKAATLEQQITEAKTNIAQIDWRKQPIYAFEAKAEVIVRPLEKVGDFESLPKSGFFQPNPMLFGQQTNAVLDDSGGIHLYLGRARRMAKGWDGASADIVDDKAQRSVATELNGTNQWLRFVIHFGGHNLYNKFANAPDFSNAGLTPDDFDAINLVLPLRCEIVWGEVQISIDNGLTNRVFQIPKQTSFVQSVTSVETNGTFIPIDFSAEIRADIEKSEAMVREKADAEAKFIARGVELEAKAHDGQSNDRTITDQMELFIELLGKYPKTPVKVFVFAGNGEPEKYALRINQLLQSAGYGAGAGIVRIEGQPSQASSNPLAFLMYGSPTNPADGWIPTWVPFNDTKPIISSGLTNEANMFHRGILNCVKWAFSGIGLAGNVFLDDTKLKSGEVGIVVLPRKN